MLDDLVNGLDLKLDEQGGFLSSGQGQLVMIIRALLSEPDVLILDEAFSNIDQERLSKFSKDHRDYCFSSNKYDELPV